MKFPTRTSPARSSTNWRQSSRATPVAETVRALGDLIRAGKLRSYGLSNHPVGKIAEFARTADALNVDRPAATQPLYNLANRQVEAEHLPAAKHYRVGVVSYSPLARGVLTAKYEPGKAPPPGTRAGRDDKRILQTEWRAESLDIAQRVKEHVEGRGITPGQFALAWVLNNRLITSAIAGPRTLEQWEDYLPALQYRFTDDDEALVDALVTTGHSSLPASTIRAIRFSAVCRGIVRRYGCCARGRYPKGMSHPTRQACFVQKGRLPDRLMRLSRRRSPLSKALRACSVAWLSQ
ncbi:aryl-alcohol dehydrogenase-like predicted oxidoreductase [Variovorax paradoxus]|nr:aryl-alcohol dehydrogenase-like predicted oxidoreductase [Variovorax paradoxus]